MQKRRSYKKLGITIFLILAVCVAARFCFVNMGDWLVLQDKPAQSDVIVVLMGSGPDRMMGAADLYQQGYADQILMVRSYESGLAEAREKGINIPGEPDVAVMVGLQMGVPQEDMTVLPGEAGSTQDEASYVCSYFAEHPEIDSMILVTSTYHSMRASKIFKAALESLNHEVRVISCPTSYDNAEPEQWWRSEEDKEFVIMEYIKLVKYCFVDRFRL